MMSRSVVSLALLLLFSAMSISSPCFAQGGWNIEPETLELNVSKGVPPLAVRIVGPKQFVDRVNNWNGRWLHGSSGFSISWGDGSRDPVMIDNPNPKKDYLQHSYAVPGVYYIYATEYHLGATDAAVTDWKAGAELKVLGNEQTGTANQNMQIVFLSPKGGESCTYQNFPSVEWRLDTDRRVDVHIELMSGEKVLTHQVVKGVANRGFQHKDRLQFRSWDDLDAILRQQGIGKFKVRIILVDQYGKSIFYRDSREFTMRSELQIGNGALKLVDSDPTKPTTVTVAYDVWHPRCFSYKLEWGDGEISRHTAPPNGAALLDKKEYKFVHTYASKSKYKIKLYSNNHDPFKKVEDIVSYESLDIDLMEK